MIIPLRASCENFLVFKDHQEFQFKTSGLHYIYGIDHDADRDETEFSQDAYNVGVGKSSLAMLLEYALYGEIQRNTKKDRIINKHAQKNLFVQLDFIHSQTGDIYRIERYRKHQEYKDKIFLFKQTGIDWHDISALDKNPTQELINNLAVIDKKTHEKSVLFTRDDKTQFLELSTTLRGEIFENVVQIGKLKKLYAKELKKLKATEDELTLVNNELIRVSTLITRDKQYIEEIKISYENKKNSLTREINNIRQKIAKITALPKPVNELLEDIKKYQEIKADHTKITQEWTKSQTEMTQFRTNLDQNKSKLSAKLKLFPEIIKGQGANQSLSSIVDPILIQLPVYRKLETEVQRRLQDFYAVEATIDQQKSIKSKYEQSVASFDHQIQNFDIQIQNHEPVKCFKCGAVQNEEEFAKHHDHLIKDRANAANNAADVRKQIVKIDMELMELYKKKDAIDSEVSPMQEMLQKMNTELAGYIDREQDLRELPSLFNTFQHSKSLAVEAEAKFQTLGLTHKALQIQMDDLRVPPELLVDPESIKNLQQFNDMIVQKEAELNGLNIEPDMQRIDNEILKIEGEQADWMMKRDLLTKIKNVHQFWIEALDFKNENSVKQYVVAKVIPVFNNFVQQMVDCVFHGELIITFDSFFNETILFHGDDYEYDELSTGQRVKLNFCINLAIFDLTRVNLDGVNIIFMDEIFTNIDLPSIVVFLNIIKERYTKDNGVYLISHQSEVRESFIPDSIIRIDKKNWEANIVIER